jgi:hypothetical protein
MLSKCAVFLLLFGARFQSIVFPWVFSGKTGTNPANQLTAPRQTGRAKE